MENPAQVSKIRLEIHQRSSPLKTFFAEAGKVVATIVIFIVLVVVLFCTFVDSLTALLGFILIFFVFMGFLAILIPILIIKRDRATMRGKTISRPNSDDGVSLKSKILLGIVCVALFAVVYMAVAG